MGIHSMVKLTSASITWDIAMSFVVDEWKNLDGKVTRAIDVAFFSLFQFSCAKWTRVEWRVVEMLIWNGVGWREDPFVAADNIKEQFISENEKSKKSAQTFPCESCDTRNSRTQAATRARLGDSLSDFIKLPQHSHNRKLYFRVRRRAVVGLEKMKSWHKLKTFLSPPSWVLNAVRMVHTNEMRGEKCSPVDFQRSTFSSFTAATCFLHNKSFIQFKSSCRTFFKAP